MHARHTLLTHSEAFRLLASPRRLPPPSPFVPLLFHPTPLAIVQHRHTHTHTLHISTHTQSHSTRTTHDCTAAATHAHTQSTPTPATAPPPAPTEHTHTRNSTSRSHISHPHHPAAAHIGGTSVVSSAAAVLQCRNAVVCAHSPTPRFLMRCFRALACAPQPRLSICSQ